MRYLVLGVLCVAAVFGFWRAGLSRGAVQAGALVPQVDARVEEWKTRNVPASRRTVDIVISDSETAALEDMLPENTEGLSAWDSQALTLGNRPSPLKKLTTWFRRKFLRRSMHAAEATMFAKAFSDDPDAVVWTHSGFASASEAEMQSEIGRAAAKALAAGARVNIVTQGISAVPALRAVEALKGAEKGAPAPVHKFVAVDMNVPTLQRYSPQDYAKFARPKNAGEWAGVWTSASSPETATMELFSPAYDGMRFSCNEVLSVLGVEGEASAADVIWLVKSLIRQNFPMEQVAVYLEKASKGKERESAADLAAKRHREEFERKKAAKRSTKPEDSLSAINSAWLAKEGAGLPQRADGPEEEPAAQDPNRPKRTGWENYDEKCGKCCADAGGSWDPGEKKHCCVGADYDESIDSCGVTWVDKGGRTHDCSYRLACKGSRNR